MLYAFAPLPYSEWLLGARSKRVTYVFSNIIIEIQETVGAVYRAVIRLGDNKVVTAEVEGKEHKESYEKLIFATVTAC